MRTGSATIEAEVLGFLGPDSQRGRRAASAAGQQSHLFDFIALLYANQKQENTGWLNDNTIIRAAASIPGTDVRKLLRDRSKAQATDLAARFDREAAANGVRRTPTILVGKTGQRLRAVNLISPTDEASLAAAIEQASH